MAEDMKKEVDEELAEGAANVDAEATAEENAGAEATKADDVTAENPCQAEAKEPASSDADNKDAQIDEGATDKDGKKFFGKKDKKKDINAKKI